MVQLSWQILYKLPIYMGGNFQVYVSKFAAVNKYTLREVTALFFPTHKQDPSWVVKILAE